MGISLIGTAADGEALGAFMVPPVVTGLELLAFTGSNETRSRRNRAGLLLATATKNGAPTFAADKMSGCNTVHNLEFPILETPSCTIIVAAKPETSDLSLGGNRPAYAGWFSSGAATEGAVLFPGGATLMRGSACYSISGVSMLAASSISSYTGSELYAPRVFALQIASGIGHQLFDLTKNVAAPLAANVNPRSVSGRNFRLGGCFLGNNGEASIYACMVANVAWTKDEIDHNAAWIASFLLKNRGISGLIPAV